MCASSQFVIQEGNHVLLKKADNLRLFQIKREREIWLDKTKFFLDGIIGHPFGTRFEVKDGQMVKITKDALETTSSIDNGSEEKRDNRNLHDLDSNQKLTADEIDQLKKEGVSGEKLIEQLIENSTTFQTKTGYAQEKWVKKKKKKHVLQFTVLKPTSRLLCELYWSRGPSKICNLRIDTLAQMLTWGNVRAHSTVAVVDSCLGLVTGAVMERLAGFGKVISFYHGGNPVRAPLDAYDFPQEVRDTLLHFPLEQLNALRSHKIKGTKPVPDQGTQPVPDNETPPVADTGSEPIAGSEPVPDTGSTSIKDTGTKPVGDTGSEPPRDTMSGSVPDTGSEQVKDTGSEQVQDSQTVSVPDKGSKYIPEQGNSCEETGLGGTVTEMAKEGVDTGSKSDKMCSVTNLDSDAKLSADVISDSVKAEDSPMEEDTECDTGMRKSNRRGRGRKRKSLKERETAREDRSKEIEKVRSVLLQENIDCLIVASKFYPTPIVTTLVDFMAPSRQVVVFSQFKEALEDCYVYLREHGGLVSYRLTETWLRNYQVLPNRTHPVIQMSGTGGYLLTATTVTKPSN